MAIFGKLDVVKKELNDTKFYIAYEYLEKVLNKATEENKRLLHLGIGAFEKVDLDDENFALEQVYNSKKRNKCFFESHKRYIDVQFILEGEEIIEVSHIHDLDVDHAYDEQNDLIRYRDANRASSLKLKKGDVAVFFPEDAHMPCLENSHSVKVVKTVVKVKV